MPAIEMKVLMITDVNFWEKSSGNRTRIAALVDYLASKVALSVIHTGPCSSNIIPYIQGTFGVNFTILEEKKYCSSTGYSKRVKNYIKDLHFDIIIIQYIHNTYLLEHLVAMNPVLILDAHDIISERNKEFDRFKYKEKIFEIDQEEEFKIFGFYDHVIVLCQEDETMLSEVCGLEKPLLCPHPTKNHQIKINNIAKNIIFVASSYLPNLDAIDFFIKECWPEIRQETNLTLMIFGTVCDKLSQQADERIELCGYVSNLSEVYGQADIVINPVRFGAGVKIKNLEALSFGLPLITSSHGARGLGDKKRFGYVVADSPAAYIEKIKELANDFEQRKSMSLKAQVFAARQTPERCFKPLLDVINKVEA